MAYAYNTALCAISIHAPREGSDPMDEIGQGQKRISIHAPREGSDRCCMVEYDEGT